MSFDYQKELETYTDATPEEKAELAKLAIMQKDIAVGGSAEDFIRHPFFKTFENQMNAMIGDAKGEMASILKRPGTTMADLQAYQAGIDRITELKKWLNGVVMAGRIGKQAIEIYESDTDELNNVVQEAVDKAKM